MGSWDPTHALTLNGGASVTEVCKLLDPEAMLRRVLSGMDGQQEFAVSLARLPEGTRLWDPRPSGWPLCFLQAAGAATAMMVEVSQFDASGELGLYKLGCRGSDEQGAAQLEVRWRGRAETVPKLEVFTVQQAGDIFVHYYRTDSVPDWCTLRRFE